MTYQYNLNITSTTKEMRSISMVNKTTTSSQTISGKLGIDLYQLNSVLFRFLLCPCFNIFNVVESVIGLTL